MKSKIWMERPKNSKVSRRGFWAMLVPLLLTDNLRASLDTWPSESIVDNKVFPEVTG